MVKVDHKAVLIVIDGWGIPGPDSPPDGDSIAAADTPTMSGFKEPNSKTAQGYTELDASSLAVGLPEGLMGNSEVGHLNIGAGRVVWQDVVRIDQALKKGEMNKTENIVKSFRRAKDGNGRLHLLGLVSDGGVHSHINHLFGLLQVAKELQVPKVYIHFFGDGRDTDPKSAAGYMQQLLDKTKELGVGEVATVVGRYYAMDRDKRWDRIEVAMEGLVTGKEGEESTDPVNTIEKRYEKGENDEFLKPIIVGGQERRIQDNDTLFFFNYRSDRVREITQLLGNVDRSPKPNFPYPKNISITTMTMYKTEYNFPTAFPPQHMGNVLAEWLSKKGLKQCHVAETEKYAHVTFFFNGGVEKQFHGEERDMIPSPKVATYDLDPKMSAAPVAEKLAERISDNKFEFLMNNFAPPDMVGHTGVYEAAIQAVTATDKAIERVYQACKENGYVLFVTADHGNAEEMKNAEGTPKTSHTTNKVPFVMANAPEGWSLKKSGGVLGDVAPTILAAMGIEQPEEMSGTSLLIKG
ncbi:2,3-bisphosphoglycerate-independent phosphoglycerate mutase [Paracoccidioides brasiliensis Pb18]|uniref:2,3-bisphosphoglycerate-independent phosphoglycerate mutase n=1 Tax=Paracoccidioides brasiliensis (strain Pb18) TaxID=502780 RepID=C1GCX3_PARBD|nr:2,3-bisphosphoglycerate-independent phosphoglycerate mutase [Paracoccidioides brasiliensis Pb18]EEH49030.1 2,3-bisphosphoglycerate-independent phosphoglycerate mutase [Paracoccidioides brasiliensis Pb18]